MKASSIPRPNRFKLKQTRLLLCSKRKYIIQSRESMRGTCNISSCSRRLRKETIDQTMLNHNWHAYKTWMPSWYQLNRNTIDLCHQGVSLPLMKVKSKWMINMHGSNIWSSKNYDRKWILSAKTSCWRIKNAKDLYKVCIIRQNYSAMLFSLWRFLKTSISVTGVKLKVSRRLCTF